jgi:hypothetical protein
MIIPLVPPTHPPPRPSPSRGEGEGYVSWVLELQPFENDSATRQYAPPSPTIGTLVSPHPQFSQSISPPPPLRGRAGVGGDFGQQPHGIVEAHHDAIEVVANFPVPSPVHSVTARFQPARAFCVPEQSLRLAMLHAVDLDDEPTLQADKINNINADGMLTAESQTISAPLAKLTPNHAFFFRGTRPKSASERGCHGLGLTFVSQSDWHNPRSTQTTNLQHRPSLYPQPTCPSPSSGEGEGHVGWVLEHPRSEKEELGLGTSSLHTPGSPHPQLSQSISPPPPLRGRAGVGGDLAHVGKVSL